MGTLGGKFTTVEGILLEIKDQVWKIQCSLLLIILTSVAKSSVQIIVD
jgi:hypothetical protein